MEITQSEQRPGKHISRRDFLKVVGASAAGGWLALKHWINENGPASLLSGFLLGGVQNETPTEFLNEKEDPNPSFENPDRLLEKSFQLYNGLRKKDPSQYPLLSYTKRKNYISAEDILERYKTFTPQEIVEDIASKQFSIASKTLRPGGDIYKIDQSTGGEILVFSGSPIQGVNDLIKIDPGSGFINRAISRNFNVDRVGFYSSHNPEKSFSEDWVQIVQESVVKDLTDAMNYFKSERAKSNTELDLSEALIYFYKLNQGDIYAGLWDSVMFFKLFARNNLNSLNFDPTFDQSIALAELFIDPFSPRNSFNWLAHKYQEKGITEEDLLDQPKKDSYSAGFKNAAIKDWLLVNRAGGIYHGLNILTWAATCMDSSVVEIVTTAYSSWKVDDMTSIDEHGKIKIESDLIVAMKSPEIRQVVDRYVKVE